MEKNNCTTNSHQYGLWQLENDFQVSRTCNNCPHKEILPMTKEPLEQAKIQENAKIIVYNLLNNPNNDIIDTISIIIKVIYYIDNNTKSLIINKLNEIRLKPETTEIDKSLLKKFIEIIAKDKNEIIDEIDFFFKEHNFEYIESPTLETKQKFSR